MYTIYAYDPNDPDRDCPYVGCRRQVTLQEAGDWALIMERHGYRTELYEELPHGRQRVLDWRK